MTAIVLLVGLLGGGVAAMDAEVRPGEGSVGLRAGYRYTPSAFASESEDVGDPVTSTYLGAPTAALRFDYYPLASVPVTLDVEWGWQRHELASEGWIETQEIGFSISSGYQLDAGLPVQPYALLGFDFVPTSVRDSIKSAGIASSLSATFGMHAAAGVVAPAIIPALPWLSPLAEVRYTYAVLAMRRRTYHLLGASVMLGAQLRFDTSSPLTRGVRL